MLLLPEELELREATPEAAPEAEGLWLALPLTLALLDWVPEALKQLLAVALMD